MMKKESAKKALCVLFGGGGHAKVVIDCMKLIDKVQPYAVLDSDQSLWGKEIFGVPIRGGDSLLEKLKEEGVTYFISAVGGVKDNGPRKKLFEWGTRERLLPFILCHPSAVISPYATLGAGTVVFAGAVINPGVVIGKNCIINTGAIVDHDCVIGDHVHISPGVTLSGGVRVGNGSHVGTGASVRQEIDVGEEAVVGAGSVVVRDVAAKVTVKGIPAK